MVGGPWQPLVIIAILIIVIAIIIIHRGGENLGLAGGVAVEVAGGAPVPGEVGSGSAACIFNLHSGAEQTFCTLLKRSSGAAQQWKMELKGQQLKLKIIPAIARRTDGFALRYIIPYP